MHEQPVPPETGEAIFIGSSVGGEWELPADAGGDGGEWGLPADAGGEGRGGGGWQAATTHISQ